MIRIEVVNLSNLQDFLNDLEKKEIDPLIAPLANSTQALVRWWEPPVVEVHTDVPGTPVASRPPTFRTPTLVAKAADDALKHAATVPAENALDLS